MVNAPEITYSTAEERREFIRKKYPCIADCDMCGLCKVFRGRDAEHAFEDYICAACARYFAAVTQNTPLKTILRENVHLWMFRQIIRGSF